MSEAPVIEEVTLNQLIEQRANIKAQMDQLNRQLKDLRAAQDDIDVQLFKKMDAEGLSRTANDIASVSINEDTVPEVTDWHVFHDHVGDTRDFSLFQQRLSSTACKEMWKLGENIPGVRPRTIRRINFRSL